MQKNLVRRFTLSKTKKKVGQFDNYKKWTTTEGCTFMAKDKEDAKLYLKKAGITDSFKEVEVKILD